MPAFLPLGATKTTKKGARARRNPLLLDLSLKNILNCDEATKAFALFLAVHLAIENLYFYKAVEEFQKSFDEMNENDKLRMATDIFNRYVSLNSTFQINLSAKARDSITTDIDQSNICIGTFAQALKEVSALMSDAALLNKFSKSKYYKMYKNELNMCLELKKNPSLVQPIL